VCSSLTGSIFWGVTSDEEVHRELCSWLMGLDTGLVILSNTGRSVSVSRVIVSVNSSRTHVSSSGTFTLFWTNISQAQKCYLPCRTTTAHTKGRDIVKAVRKATGCHSHLKEHAFYADFLRISVGPLTSLNTHAHGSNLELYWARTGLESRHSYQPTWLRFVAVFISLSRWMLGKCLQICNGCSFHISTDYHIPTQRDDTDHRSLNRTTEYHIN
jgi:hypothetical protein